MGNGETGDRKKLWLEPGKFFLARKYARKGGGEIAYERIKELVLHLPTNYEGAWIFVEVRSDARHGRAADLFQVLEFMHCDPDGGVVTFATTETASMSQEYTLDRGGVFVAGIRQIQLEKPGVHEFAVWADGDLLATYKLPVREG